jgi:hypothetical protein
MVEIAFLSNPEVLRKILRHHGLPLAAPPPRGAPGAAPSVSEGGSGALPIDPDDAGIQAVPGAPDPGAASRARSGAHTALHVAGYVKARRSSVGVSRPRATERVWPSRMNRKDPEPLGSHGARRRSSRRLAAAGSRRTTLTPGKRRFRSGRESSDRQRDSQSPLTETPPLNG